MTINKIKNLIPTKFQDALLTLSDRKRGRYASVFDDDIFITSYPKSGNTWLRFLIGYLVHGNTFTGFNNIEEKIPDIYVNKEYQLLKVNRPRILKSHEYFDHRYKNVIYIVRDPRDVVLSYYSFHQKVGSIEQNYPIEKYVEKFVDGNLDRYGSWEENVGSWIGARETSKHFLLVRYEDLLENIELQLSNIANFINIQVDDESISKAIEFCSAKNMKKLEREQNNNWATTKNSRKDIAFVRSAKSGNWQNQLPLSLAETIEESWGSLMKKLGYL